MGAQAKNSNEVATAKLSARQAVVVALIGLLSAVAVAAITNFDKLAGTGDETNREIGFCESRALNVERSFREAEESLRSQSESAREGGRLDEAGRLAALAADVRTEGVKFQERHRKRVEALKDGKRMEAEVIRTEADEKITKVNIALREAELPIGGARKPLGNAKRESMSIPLYQKEAATGFNKLVSTDDEEMFVTKNDEEADRLILAASKEAARSLYRNASWKPAAVGYSTRPPRTLSPQTPMVIAPAGTLLAKPITLPTKP